MRLILFILAVMLSSVAAFSQTLSGFNQTHFANHVTDSKCKVVPALVHRVITEIPAERRQFCRFPGGTVANFYTIDMYGHTPAEAKNSKWQRAKINPIVPFIEASKIIGWDVIPVINLVEIYNGKYTFDHGMELNLRMIKMFVDAGINVPYIELGNELNIWMNIKGNSDYNRNKAEYDREIQRYYELSVRANMLIKSIYPEIKTAAVSARFGYNARDNKWSSLFNYGDWDGIVIHHYEDSADPKIWKERIAEMKQQADFAGKELLLTEVNVKLGPSVNSPAYRTNIKQTWLRDYQSAIWDICKRLKVNVLGYHNISGTDGHIYNYLNYAK